MVALRDRSQLLIFGLLATAVYLAEILAVRVALPTFPSPHLLAAAVAFDLVVVVPAAYWWLRVRGRGSAWQVAPVFVLSLMGAAAVLPAGSGGIAAALPWLAIPAEVLVLAMVARKAARALRDPAPGDVADRVRRAARETLPHPRVADAVAFELGLLWYALAGWRGKVPADTAAFSYHKRSGYGGILFALAVASVVEMTAVHLLVVERSHALAWTLTAVSAYGLLWMLGDYHAVRLRPFRVEPDGLHLRIGLRWSAVIPWRDVAAVEPVGRRELPRAPGYLKATVMGEPRLLMELRRPVRAEGPYGITRQVTRIGLSPDDEARFLRAVAERTEAVEAK